MTKAEICRKIEVLTGIGHQEVALTVDALISTVKKSVRDGKTVHLRGFGRFKPVHRMQKIGQNMNTGQPMVIPAKKVVKFIPSKTHFKL